MSEATSKTCEECGGRGFRGVKGGLCPTCNGTGIVTTGEVVGTPLPRWPEVRPIREESGARAMSDKATTTTCSACGGTGFFDARHSDRFCPTCEGTGTAPNGNSPENPESSGEVAGTPGPTVAESIERLERDEPTITVTHNGAATVPFPDRYIGPQPDTPTRNGTCDHCGGRGKVLGPLDEIQTCGVCDGTGDEWIPKSILDSAPRLHVECACDECAKPRDATGHDGCIRGLEKAKAEAEYLRNKLHETERAGDIRIAEQAAEIERLRERVSGLEQLHASWADGSLAELTAERDALRAAVDHLKGERDTLRSALEIAAARSDSQNASISYFEQESASHNAALAEATTERDVLRLEVQRLKDERFEAMDRYAALEAERDELRVKVSHLDESLVELADVLATMEAERDELLAWKSGMRAVLPADDMCPDCNGHGTIFSPTEPLPDLCYLCSGTGKVAPSTLKAAGGSERDALKKRISDLEGKHGWQWYEQKLAEANARAESYLRVIEAMERERDSLAAYYLDHHNTIAAQSAAGYRIGEAPAWQAVRDLVVKEADHG